MIVTPMVLSYFLGYRIDTIEWCRVGKSIHDGAIYLSAMDILILVVERSVATVYVRIYERRNYVTLGISLLILQVI
jgi:hypothetical protein